MLRIEFLEVFNSLADSDIFKGNIHFITDTYNNTALGRSVQLGQNQTVDAHSLMK